MEIKKKTEAAGVGFWKHEEEREKEGREREREIEREKKEREKEDVVCVDSVTRSATVIFMTDHRFFSSFCV